MAIKNIHFWKLAIRGWNGIRRFGRVDLVKCFKLVCLLMTLSLVIWCCYEFSKNEDVCEVSFKRFHQDEDSIYPNMIFGLPNKFNESALKLYDNSFEGANYGEFLTGGYWGGNWNEKMLDIDFEKVSMRIQDYVIKTSVYETMKDARTNTCNDNVVIKQHNAFDHSITTLHFPSTPITIATIFLKNSIFQNGIRPTDMQFYVLFAYPNQFYRSFSSAIIKWPLRTNESAKNYKMRFSLKGMEVLRKRPKEDNKCYSLENYDGRIRDMIIENVGCRPTMWDINGSVPLCTTRKSFQELLDEHWDQGYQKRMNKNYLEPCLTIEKIQIDYDEVDLKGTRLNPDIEDEDWLMLEFLVVADKFKEIRQVRKYSVQSLVGNSGGYIGLCLGYALWNVPHVLLDVWKYVKSSYSCQQLSLA